MRRATSGGMNATQIQSRILDIIARRGATAESEVERCLEHNGVTEAEYGSVIDAMLDAGLLGCRMTSTRLADGSTRMEPEFTPVAPRARRSAVRPVDATEAAYIDEVRAYTAR